MALCLMSLPSVNPTCSRLQFPPSWKVMHSYLETSKMPDKLVGFSMLNTDGDIYKGTKPCHRTLPKPCFQRQYCKTTQSRAGKSKCNIL